MTNQVNNDVIKPIEYDHEMDRFYIPVNSRYEIQTKGKGSSFRIANTYTKLRSIVLNDALHPVLEDMAKATNAEMGQLQATTKASESEINSLKERVEELQASNNQLREAGQALVERWDSPNWSDGTHTRDYIDALRKALSSTPAQSLAEHDNDVIERCAVVCESLKEQDYCVDVRVASEAIRAIIKRNANDNLSEVKHDTK